MRRGTPTLCRPAHSQLHSHPDPRPSALLSLSLPRSSGCKPRLRVAHGAAALVPGGGRPSRAWMMARGKGGSGGGSARLGREVGGSGAFGSVGGAVWWSAGSGGLPRVGKARDGKGYCTAAGRGEGGKGERGIEKGVKGASAAGTNVVGIDQGSLGVCASKKLNGAGWGEKMGGTRPCRWGKTKLGVLQASLPSTWVTVVGAGHALPSRLPAVERGG